MASEETSGWNLLTNRAERSLHLIQSPADDELLAIETIAVNSTLRPVIKEGIVSIEAHIKAEARIAEFPGTENLEEEKRFTESLVRRTAQAIEHT